MAISIALHDDDVQGGTIPERMHEVFVLRFSRTLMCGANAASDVLKITENPYGRWVDQKLEHEKKR